MTRYRLYIDESGDHTYSCFDEPQKRYLGLTGVIVESEYYRTQFHPSLEALKQTHFPHNPDEPVVLHRRDIIDKANGFWALKNPEKEARFNEDLLGFLAGKDYQVLTAVIDKWTHYGQSGDAAGDPYHLCLLALLDCYCDVLVRLAAVGDVMIESRQKTEDFALKGAYHSVWQNGSSLHPAEKFKTVLSSNEIKCKPKAANIAGLQVADLLAQPCKQQVLVGRGCIEDSRQGFGTAVCERVAWKHCDYDTEAYARVCGPAVMLHQPPSALNGRTRH